MIVSTTVIAAPPSVELLGASMPAGVTRLSILRDAGGESWPVRGAQDALVGTGFQIFDHEPPVGLPITYRVTAYASSGAVLDSATVTLTLPDVDCSSMWVSDPLDETSALLVEMQVGTDESRRASRDVQVATPLGSGRWPILSAGPLVQLQGWSVVTVLHSAAEVAALRGLLTEAVVLCIRPASKLQLPAVMYGVLDWTEEPWHEQAERTSRFVGSLTPGRPTALPVTIYAWTYADVAALGGTYADLLTRYATYADLRRGEV